MKKQYLYPQNMRTEAKLWFWGLKDIMILAVALTISVVSWAKLNFIIPAALTLIYGFLSMRLDECSVLDYIKRAARFFLTTQQYYEWGEKRTCAYFSRFDRVERCHVVTLEGGRGSFAGERACADREVLLRIHLSPARVARVRVNGEDVPFEIVRRDASAYPFSFAGAAPDSDVLLVRFGLAVSEGAEVAVCLK